MPRSIPDEDVAILGVSDTIRLLRAKSKGTESLGPFRVQGSLPCVRVRRSKEGELQEIVLCSATVAS